VVTVVDSGGAQGRPAGTLAPGPSRQRFEGWGGGVVSETAIDPLASTDGLSPSEIRQMDRMAFEQAGVKLLRIWSPGAGFGSRDGRLRRDDGRFRLMRRAARRGVRFMLTGADAAPRLKDGKALRHGAERAYARSLAGVLGFARRRAGVRFAWVAVGNEVDNTGGSLVMEPAQARTVYEALARLIRSRRLGARIVLGDNTTWPTSLDYVATERRARGVRRSLAAIASHGYGGEDTDRERFRRLASSLGTPVWMTEWTPACPKGDCPDDLGIEPGLTRAERIVTDLTVAGASAWFMLRPVADSSHGGDDGLVVTHRQRPEGQRLVAGRKLDVMRQFAWAGRRGARVHAVPAADGDLRAVAFSRGRRLAMVVVNLTAQSREVQLDLGADTGALASRVTSADRGFAASPGTRYTGRPVGATVLPHSVTTWVLTAGGS
jgi:hypothetical protein